MNTLKTIFFIFIALTVALSQANAGDSHTHARKNHRYVTKKSAKSTKKNAGCVNASDPSQCESVPAKDHEHKDGDGHDHSKKKSNRRIIIK